MSLNIMSNKSEVYIFENNVFHSKIAVNICLNYRLNLIKKFLFEANMATFLSQNVCESIVYVNLAFSKIFIKNPIT